MGKKRVVKKRVRKKRTAPAEGALFDGGAGEKPKASSQGASGRGGGGASGGGGVLAAIEPTPLHEAARSRYLNYALSVITSRALPDVRDGLKPVQRRILYTMWRLRLSSDAKPRKCASVCGDVMGQYHPHGDQAIYDALVRMAQPWVLREPLIEGVGNFGSMDADPAAAYRYTECRLRPIATELLDELDQDAVHERATYDNERTEPVVLPSRAPTLLINGAQGIAVGMATSIPPHNLGEVCRALLKLMDKPDARTSSLIANDAIQGPDFPTGGEVLTSRTELRAIYETGHGSIKVRGTWKNGEVARSSQTVTIDSIPYGVNKAQLVEQIADVVLQRKLAGLVDVRDLSAEDVRIDLELKKDADPAKVMAYLYRQTSLQNSFAVNLTCLVPTGNPEVGRPERLGLAEVLRYFLIFRHEVATRRLEHEERALRKRIHMLEGFRVVFDALDEVIAIIRASDGKADAARRLMERFPAPPPSEAPEEDAPKSAAGKRPIKKGRGKAKPVIQVTQGLDAEQTDAILELKLYRLARLEIRVILDELKKRHARLKEVLGLLADDQDDYAAGRWALVRGEIDSLLQTYGDKNAKRPEGKRRTRFAAVTAEDEPVFNEADFIVEEDAVVLVTADGWIKRQKQIDPASTRLREGDRVLACVAGSTRSVVALFSNRGVCYSARIVDIPATTGYGEPVQKLFKLGDGEKIVAAISLDPRVVDDLGSAEASDIEAPTHGLAATSDGYALRFGLAGFAEPSTRAGRKFARPKSPSEVVGAVVLRGGEKVLAVSADCRALVCKAKEVNYLQNAGRGVQLMKLAAGDKLLGFKASTGDRDLLRVTTSGGAEETISSGKYKPVSRGGKGVEVRKRGSITGVIHDPVEAPAPLDGSAG